MNIKVGIPLINDEINGSTGWVAGFYLIKNCLNALASLTNEKIPEVIVFTPEDFSEELLISEYQNNNDWLKVVKISKELLSDQKNYKQVEDYINAYGCQIIFPYVTIPRLCIDTLGFGWVPDFQDKYFPEFFSEAELKYRDLTTKFLLGYCNKIFCSSQTVLNDLKKFYPETEKKGEMIHFRAVISESYLQNDPKQILQKYDINGPYIYLPNQFWKHKNHQLVFEAWKILKDKDINCQLICTGASNDYRFPNYYEELLTYLKTNHLTSSVRILGFISREDQINLYRNSMAVLQPSLFEGWSTSLEEAKLLGKPLIVSDIAIHKEQCGDSAYYFNKSDAGELALLIIQLLDKLPSGYQAQNEANARQTYQLDIQQFARSLINSFKSITDSAQNDKVNKKLWLNIAVNLNNQLQDKEAMIRLLKRAYDERDEVIASNSHILAQITKLEKKNMKVIEFCKSIYYAQYKITQEQKYALLAYLRRSISGLIRIFYRPKLGAFFLYDPKKLTIPSRYNDKNTNKIFPRISIVTPSFNQGNFIKRTISSVLEQNYPNLEYIVQDGCSSDNTVEILTEYHGLLKHWESIKDEGQSQAINLGFQHATGEVMAYLNSDDILLPGTLDYVANFFVENPHIDVVYGHRILINEYDHEIGRWVLPPHDNTLLSWADYIPQETLFWRRSIWEKTGSRIDESYRFAMDWELLLRFRDAGAKFMRLPRFLGAFRIHSHQKSSAQISNIGVKEMARLRLRCHGVEVTHREINKNIRSYMLKHLIYHKLYKLGLLRY